MLAFPKVFLSIPPVLILALFLLPTLLPLPWITLTYDMDSTAENVTPAVANAASSNLLSASGLDLALGNLTLNESAGNSPESTEIDITTRNGDYELFLIPLLAFFAGAVVFIADELLKGIYVGAAVVGLVVMVLYWLELRTDLTELSSILVGYEFAWWTTLLMLVGMLLLGMAYDNNAN